MFEHHFSRFSSKISEWGGSPLGFTLAFLIILLWGVLGPVTGYSELWQLAINTGTTIVTFLMVFVIQNSQNRDTRAIQIKIDELIRATQGASNSLLDLETLSASEIKELHERYYRIATRAKELGLNFESGSPELPTTEEEARERAIEAAAQEAAKAPMNTAKVSA